ncbi:uncharacterized protein LOC143898459 [Temnothorax americanus]|uniref:uncharacterized protein LOC143898459 n=1 Tax=Temnothorax americanus TaxID=1964332 RepID=UPI0040676615
MGSVVRSRGCVLSRILIVKNWRCALIHAGTDEQSYRLSSRRIRPRLRSSVFTGNPVANFSPRIKRKIYRKSGPSGATRMIARFAEATQPDQEQIRFVTCFNHACSCTYISSLFFSRIRVVASGARRISRKLGVEGVIIQLGETDPGRCNRFHNRAVNRLLTNKDFGEAW